MTIKIGVLGAGSGIFSLNLMRDLCLTESLHGSEVCLMDIDEKRLDASYTLCTRLAQELGSCLHTTKTPSREACLTGADYVINTILMGGYQGWHDGWKIAQKWGYRRGGSLHVMHDEAFWTNFYQLRMMESVHRDILRICPDAWYLMVCNPVFAGTTYLQRKYPQVKMVGLCHGTGQIRYIAEKMGLDFDKVCCEIPGVNHFVWLNQFYYEGRDAFKLLDKWIEEQSEAYFKTCPECDFFGPKVVDLYKRYGVLPIGDTANPGGGAWGYEYHSDREVEKTWKEDPETWFNAYFVASAAHVAEIERAAYDESRPVRELIACEKSHEPMVPVIEALACGKVEISLKGKIRTILIPGKLCKKLKKYAKKKRTVSGEIFITKNGTGLSRKQIWAEMKAICQRAKVAASKVFPHNLRHLFARTFYKVCRDVAKLADVLGHSSIETTRIYLISTGKEHNTILDKLRLTT